jgi:aldose 1-epimerase
MSLTLFLSACGNPASDPAKEVESKARLKVQPFGNTPEGMANLYTLRNANGMEVMLTDFGGIVTQIRVPDREGKVEDVTLGFDSLAPYLGEHPFFGSLVGRYGNRIGGAVFRLEGKEYTLAANNGPNTLHGGVRGFNRYLHEATPIEEGNFVGVELSRVSPDGEESFPGNLEYRLRYLLGEQNQLRIEYTATTDAPTVVNLTPHSYFNLKCQGNGDILDHLLIIRAHSITPVS